MTERGKTKTPISFHSGRPRTISTAALSMTCASDSSGTTMIKFTGLSNSHSFAAFASRSQMSSIGKAFTNAATQSSTTFARYSFGELREGYAWTEFYVNAVF